MPLLGKYAAESTWLGWGVIHCREESTPYTEGKLVVSRYFSLAVFLRDDLFYFLFFNFSLGSECVSQRALSSFPCQNPLPATSCTVMFLSRVLFMLLTSVQSWFTRELWINLPKFMGWQFIILVHSTEIVLKNFVIIFNF